MLSIFYNLVVAIPYLSMKPILFALLLVFHLLPGHAVPGDTTTIAQLKALIAKGEPHKAENVLLKWVGTKGIALPTDSLGEAYMLLGKLKFQQSMGDSSMHYYKKAEALFASSGNERGRINAQLSQLDQIKSVNPEQAIEEYKKISLWAIENGDEAMMVRVNDQVMTLYYGMNFIEEAIARAKETQAYYRAKNDTFGVASYDRSMANFWFEVNTDSARHYYEKAIPLYEKRDNYLELATLYQSYGALLRTTDADRSWAYLMKSDSLAKKYGTMPRLLPLAIAKNLYLKGKVKEAVPFAKKTRSLGLGANRLYQVIMADEELAKYYKELGRYDSALFYFEEFKKMQDSVRNTRQHAEAAKLQAKLDFQKQLHEVELHEKQLQAEVERSRLIYWMGGVLFLLILVVLILVYRAYIRKQQTNDFITMQNLELERLDKLNKKIFSVISHDFKGPLLSMNIFSDFLGQQAYSPEDMFQFAKSIQDQVRQTELILENLLSWARMELETKSSISDSDIHDIAEEIRLQLAQIANSKGVVVINEVPNNARANIHADILRIALRNLVSNAIKYSYEGAKVVIGFDTQKQAYFVSDSGVGMSLDRLASLFTQSVAPAMGTRFEMGFGMGLFITFEVLRKSGWHIEVSSKQGEGSSFLFYPV